MKNKSIPLSLIALILVSSASQSRANVTLPTVLGSHMVLQRERPLPIWGWADSGEDVTVALDGATAKAKADSHGNWKVELPALKADGKPHTIVISGKNQIELTDILIGDVWIGSGQSNMEFPLRATTGGSEAVAAANHPQMRLLHIKKVKSDTPAKDIGVANGSAAGTEPAWQVCTPKAVPGFSGVLYYFGQRLHQDLHVPIGLIEADFGGSAIYFWQSGGRSAGALFNGMLAPVKPFGIRGVVWYQGEANVVDKPGAVYANQQKKLIDGWRQAWGYDFPFYFVQIAPYSKYEAGKLPIFWENQAANLKIPGTGMVVTTDLVDNLGNIHPPNKLPVGNRLALWAEARDYGIKGLVWSGPLYRSMTVSGSKIRLSFAHIGGGLKSRDDKPLSDFEIAGEDGHFVSAEAVIDAGTVIVEAKSVTSPTQVRFGWRNEATPNLINQEGLPASPFQTHDWQGGTGE